jgi:hypothetical protein
VSVGVSEAIQQDHLHAVGRQWGIESVGGSAPVQQGYVHAVGERWEIQSQRILQLSSEITYILWAGDGRDGVSE